MKRVAIVLGSPYHQNSKYHLRGVSKDVENYTSFLMASSGGAWKGSEIFRQEHLRKSAVPKIHSLCTNADIAIIIFSGHGYMRNGENYININPTESINVDQLYTTAKRQIIIIDACRVDHAIEHFEGIGDTGMFFDNTRPELGRSLYDYYLKRAPHGRYVMFSSSKNQASQDTENGGLFSYSLLIQTHDWAYKTDKPLLPVHVAFQKATYEIYSTRDNQIPEYDYTGNIIPLMPFGVSPLAYIKKYGQKNMGMKSGSGMTITTLS